MAPLIRQSKGDLGPNEGVEHVLDFLKEYNLSKEDMDNIFELTQWPSNPDPLKNVDSKTKAALTRSYNKSNIMTPYATEDKIKKTKKKSNDEEDGSENERYVQICYFKL